MFLFHRISGVNFKMKQCPPKACLNKYWICPINLVFIPRILTIILIIKVIVIRVLMTDNDNSNDGSVSNNNNNNSNFGDL